MSDLRLHRLPFEFEGRQYQLCCNMNVLADVQEAYEGNLMVALKTLSSLKVFISFLTAMINDYADSQGWEVRYTSRQVGRAISGTAENVSFLSKQVATLVRESITSSAHKDAADEDHSKN